MDKRDLSESDIWPEFICPATETAGRNGKDQINREFLRAHVGWLFAVRRRNWDKTTGLRADDTLFHKLNIPLADALSCEVA